MSGNQRFKFILTESVLSLLAARFKSGMDLYCEYIQYVHCPGIWMTKTIMTGGGYIRLVKGRKGNDGNLIMAIKLCVILSSYSNFKSNFYIFLGQCVLHNHMLAGIQPQQRCPPIEVAQRI